MPQDNYCLVVYLKTVSLLNIIMVTDVPLGKSFLLFSHSMLYILFQNKMQSIIGTFFSHLTQSIDENILLLHRPTNENQIFTCLLIEKLKFTL